MRTHGAILFAWSLLGLLLAVSSTEARLGTGRLHFLRKRDLSSTLDKAAKHGMTEGEDHSKPNVPSGSQLISIPVSDTGANIATYWSASTDDQKASQAYIMIHGRMRDGDHYWTVMNDALQSAIKDNYPGASNDTIVAAPEFYSASLNAGEFGPQTLAWGDVNTWQAGDGAVHPANTNANAFDALDALVDWFSDTKNFPNMKNITLVGHGGGGQLMNRYAAVGADPSNKQIHVRYVVGDPSSSAYFTSDRPVTDSSIASKGKCNNYNTWRYGFDGFNGTRAGKKSPKEYFTQYINRDIVNIVGYQDTDKNGDQKCMALLQGGEKRRDRNLSWWHYINTLARTNEDVSKFPGNFSSLPDWSDVSKNTIATRLVVVQGATHNAADVFGGEVGRSALFSAKSLQLGWRPNGWKPASTNSASASSTSASASSSGGGGGGGGGGAATSGNQQATAAAASPSSSQTPLAFHNSMQSSAAMVRSPVAALSLFLCTLVVFMLAI